MGISIIVPMYNTAKTLKDTLQSISQQTFIHWEALLVDDGSTDGSLEIAYKYAKSDERFRVIQQNHAGVSTARNRGIKEARYDWLLFLDSDDWILPRHLEQMTSVLRSDENLGVVVCGWCYYSSDDYYFHKDIGQQSGDLFPLHARDCPYVIHAYVVKRKIVEAVGGFDTELRTCEDWDLWQRVARTGVQFGRVPEVLAPYRIRAGSASTDGRRIFEDGLKVLHQGHEPDFRLQQGHPVYPNGLPKEGLAEKEFYMLCFAAGLLIGRGEDPSFLFEMVNCDSSLKLQPYFVASCVTLAAMLSDCHPLKEWKIEWPRMEKRTHHFLEKLEKHSGSQGLARKTWKFSRKLISIYMKDIGGIYRLNAVPSRLYLLPSKIKIWIIWKSWLILGKIKVFISALLKMMNSRLYRFIIKRYNRLYPYKDSTNFEKLFKDEVDPWCYTSDYEQTKYEQTLEMIPLGHIEDAIELACAEGHFTVQLAPRVKNLLASDISQIALDRAAERCRQLSNIRFQKLDFIKEPISGEFDLMVCSEVLYFAGSRSRLRWVARKMTNALKPGGYLVMAHANVIKENPDRTGFNCRHSFGAEGVGNTFAEIPSLRFHKEIRTPLYRIQLFQKEGRKELIQRLNNPEIIEIEKPAKLEPIVSSRVLWNGAAKTLPVLMYHSVAPSGSEELSSYRVAPEKLEEQLRYLRENGFQSISIEECQAWYYESVAIPAESILITFDDGYRDFMEYAMPLLQQYGFNAHVFLVAGEIGRTNRWDEKYGESKPILSWDEIRYLCKKGISFGSHSVTHPTLTETSWKQITQELKNSMLILQQGLGASVTSFAYPFGELNRRIQYLVGYFGYNLAFTCFSGPCTERHSPLALPRIGIEGDFNLETFVHKIGKPPSRIQKIKSHISFPSSVISTMAE